MANMLEAKIDFLTVHKVFSTSCSNSSFVGVEAFRRAGQGSGPMLGFILL